MDSALFQKPLPLLLERARKAGVRGFLVPAVFPEQWEKLAQWPKQYPECRVALGLHPLALQTLDAHNLHHLMDTLGFWLPHACAVGECGLDKGLEKTVPLDKQREWFSAQVLLSKKHALPLVIHCANAYGLLLEVLRQLAPFPAGFVLHSFSGSVEMLKAFSQLGGYFSFSGNICRPNARKACLALQNTPLERLLFETDAPFQPPFPFHHNEPALLQFIVHRAADILLMPPDKLARLSARNAQQLFSLPQTP